MAKQVTVQEAAELMKQGYKYVDVRSVPEFEAGHPEGALNIPLLHSQGGRMVPNPDFQAVVQGNLPKDEKLLVGCKMGGRSNQAAAILEASGYTDISNVVGGYSGARDMYGRVSAAGWADSGLPSSKTATPGATYSELSGKKA
jgi:rhodanese-related sulfurtransferase